MMKDNATHAWAGSLIDKSKVLTLWMLPWVFVGYWTQAWYLRLKTGDGFEHLSLGWAVAVVGLMLTLGLWVGPGLERARRKHLYTKTVE
jgi:hypothetical protein